MDLVSIPMLNGFILSLLFAASLAGGRVENTHKSVGIFKHVEEWSHWKLKHAKTYATSLDELERHLIWLSNKKYIDHHNANSHIFGFTLAMNHLGDIVSREKGGEDGGRRGEDGGGGGGGDGGE